MSLEMVMSQDWSAFLVLMTMVGKYHDDFADLGSVQLMFAERHVTLNLCPSEAQRMKLNEQQLFPLRPCSPDASHLVQDSQSFPFVGQ